QTLAEKALRESELRYRLLADEASDAIVRIKIPERTYEYISPFASRMLGYTQDELYEKPAIIRDAIHPDWRGHVEEHWQELLNGREPENLEFAIADRQGDTHWCSQHNSYIKDDDGRLIALQAIVRDITERKLLEEALKRSEKKYRSLFEHIPIGLYRLSTDGRFLSANPHAAKILGYVSPEDLMQSVEDITTQIYWGSERREEAIRLLQEEGFIENFEVQYRHKDGYPVWVSFNARLIKDDHGNTLYSIGAIRDINEHKLAEEALKRSECRYRNLIDLAVDGIVVGTDKGVIIEANECMCKLLGVTREELIGKRMSDLPFTPESLEKSPLRFDLVLNGERIESRRQLKRPDESEVIVEMHTKMMPDGIYQSIFRDITQRERVEDALLESEAKYRALIETTCTGFVILNPDGVVLDANAEYVSFIGYSQLVDIVGRNVIEWTADHDKKKNAAALKICYRKGVIRNLEIDYADSAGHITPVEINATYIKAGRNKTEIMALCRNIMARRQVDEELRRHRRNLEDMVSERTVELERKNMALKELNTTLKVLLEKREEDKKEMEERFVMNVRNLVLPYVEQMKRGKPDFEQQACLGIIEKHLNVIATPLLTNMRQFNMTPQEIKVATLVKQGKSTKEIAEILGIASGSIDVHRKNIRKKLGLNERKVNLQSRLESFDQ
ncbi:MAG: PAS domain S-box protein, partial [Syntrophales bacterium]|nr:PAS domain S-box protein [Syntrophales bacterium]